MSTQDERWKEKPSHHDSREDIVLHAYHNHTNNASVSQSGFESTYSPLVNERGLQTMDDELDNLCVNSQPGTYCSQKHLSESHDDTCIEIKDKKTSTFVYLLTLFSAIGGFLFGYDTGVISGAMLLLISEFNLSVVLQEVVVSVTIGAAAICAFLGGFLNDYFGRKPTIMFGCVIFTVGALLLGASQNISMLISGRVIVGAGVGLASTSVPVYIAECAPARLRGRLVTCNNLFITGGQFLAALLAGAFSSDKVNGWRFMFGLAAVPSMIQFVGFLFMPESPRWLMKNARYDRAKEVLSRIRPATDVDLEFKDIKLACDQERELVLNRRSRSPVLIQILQSTTARRALIVGCGLQIFQQLAGINTVMYYSATIIKMSGVRGQSEAIWLASVSAGFNFVFTIVGIWLVERIGRRPLTLGSLAGVFASLIVLAIAFQLIAFHSPPVTEHNVQSTCDQYSFCEQCTDDVDCGFCYHESSLGVVNGSCLRTSASDPTAPIHGYCNSSSHEDGYLWAYNYCPTSYSWMAFVGLLLYLAFFAPGMGPMPWMINSEIYPLWARSTANALATATNWSFNLLVSMTFLTLTHAITTYGTYWMYSGIALLGLIFVALTVPETKGKQLEEVEVLFAKPFSPCCQSTDNAVHYERLPT